MLVTRTDNLHTLNVLNWCRWDKLNSSYRNPHQQSMHHDIIVKCSWLIRTQIDIVLKVIKMVKIRRGVKHLKVQYNSRNVEVFTGK